MAVAAPVAGITALGYLLVREPEPPERLGAYRPQPLPAERASRAGVDVGTSSTKADLSAIGASWYMNWTYRRAPGVHAEFVPLVGGYPGDHRIGRSRLHADRAYVRSHAGDYPDGTIWLVGNEIGYQPQHDGRSPAQYAADFREYYQMLKAINPSWRVSVGPAVLSTSAVIRTGQRGGTGLDYLRQVVAAYQHAYEEPIPAEYVAATAYVAGPNVDQWSLLRHRAHPLDLAVFERQVRNLRRILADAGLRDRKVILTEFGDPFAGNSPQATAEFVDGAAHYVATATDPGLGCPDDTDHLVQRWAWFIAQPLPLFTKVTRLQGGALVLRLSNTSLFDRRGKLTYLGHIYAQLMGRGDN